MSRINPTKLAYHQLHGHKYNWNKHPLAPPGTRGTFLNNSVFIALGTGDSKADAAQLKSLDAPFVKTTDAEYKAICDYVLQSGLLAADALEYAKSQLHRLRDTVTMRQLKKLHAMKREFRNLSAVIFTARCIRFRKRKGDAKQARRRDIERKDKVSIFFRGAWREATVRDTMAEWLWVFIAKQTLSDSVIALEAKSEPSRVGQTWTQVPRACVGLVPRDSPFLRWTPPGGSGGAGTDDESSGGVVSDAKAKLHEHQKAAMLHNAEEKKKSTASGSSKKLTTCAMCFDDLPLDDMVSLTNCAHFSCYTCLKDYLRANLKDASKYPMSCYYAPSCSAQLDYADVQNVLSPSEVAVYDNFVVMAALKGSKRGEAVHCPLVDCDHLMILTEEDKKSPKSQCEECHRFFCCKCNRAWHEGKLCVDVDEKVLEVKKSDIQLRMMKLTKNWTQCPKVLISDVL
jgi:hypothetical protein